MKPMKLMKPIKPMKPYETYETNAESVIDLKFRNRIKATNNA